MKRVSCAGIRAALDFGLASGHRLRYVAGPRDAQWTRSRRYTYFGTGPRTSYQDFGIFWGPVMADSGAYPAGGKGATRDELIFQGR